MLTVTNLPGHFLQPFKKYYQMKIKAILPVIITAILISCNQAEIPFDSFSGFTQGTTYSVIYDNRAEIDVAEMKSNIEALLLNFDNSLSTYNPGSIISAINNNRDTVPDSLFINVYNRSRDIWEISGGAFDITAGPLVNAWGFGPDSHKRFNEDDLDSLLALVGMDKISLVDGRIVKSLPGMYLDVNAIAQGYSVDVLSQYLSGLGIQNYLVEVGGEVYAKGTKNKGEKWKVGVDKPIDNNMVPGRDLQAVISLQDKALATSGNYRRFYEENGIKYSHTIDPVTGYPVRHTLLSVTIIADDCMTADGFATACMVSGLKKAVSLVEKYDFLEGYFVYSDDEGNFITWESEGMKEYSGE